MDVTSPFGEGLVPMTDELLDACYHLGARFYHVRGGVAVRCYVFDNCLANNAAHFAPAWVAALVAAQISIRDSSLRWNSVVGTYSFRSELGAAANRMLPEHALRLVQEAIALRALGDELAAVLYLRESRG